MMVTGRDGWAWALAIRETLGSATALAARDRSRRRGSSTVVPIAFASAGYHALQTIRELCGRAFGLGLPDVRSAPKSGQIARRLDLSALCKSGCSGDARASFHPHS